MIAKEEKYIYPISEWDIAGISSFKMSLFSNESTSSFCGPSSTLYYNATQDFSKAFYIFACGINMIISISSTLGNILVLCAIRKCESLHSPSKALLFSLAMTDLFVGVVALPLSIAYYLTVILEMLNYYCVIAVSYVMTSWFISYVSLAISVERYMAFRLRLRYRAVVTFKRVVSILVSEWIIAALWSGLRLWSDTAGAISGAVSLISCCLVAPACYFKYGDSKIMDAPQSQATSTYQSTEKLFATWCGGYLDFSLLATCRSYWHCLQP